MSQNAIMELYRQTQSIFQNIENLFHDAQRLLDDRGFTPLHTGFHCAISKTSAVSMLPKYFSVFYGSPEDDEARSMAPHVLCISVILCGSREPIEPLLVGQVFEPRSKSAQFIPWWGHSAVIGDGLASSEAPSLPADFPKVIAKKGYVKSTADYWFRSVVYFQMPLTEVTDAEAVSKRLVEPACELFEAMRSAKP